MMLPLTTVNEYPLNTWSFTLSLAKEARVLSVRVQDGRSYMYVLELSSGFRQTRNFIIVNTGAFSNIDLSKMSYIASFKLAEGHVVQHLFDETVLEVPTPIEQLAACSNAT